MKRSLALVGSVLMLALSPALAQSLQLGPATTTRLVSFEASTRQQVVFTSVGGDTLDIVIHPGSGLALELALPDGRTVDVGNAPEAGATFEEATLPAGHPFLPAGAVQLIHLVAPPSGEYRLQLDATGLTDPPAAVTVEVFTSGGSEAATLLRTGLTTIGERDELEVGDVVALALVLVEGERPVLGAAAHGVVRDSTGRALAEIAFRDDGAGADATAGDGLYSAVYAADRVGLHHLTVDIEGTTASGARFSQREASQFMIFSANVHLTGAFSDRGVDLDGDGLVDRLEITMDSYGPIHPGSYQLRLVIEADNGEQVQSRDLIDLASGAPLTAVVDAEALKRLGVDGPYRIATALLSYERRFLDRLDDLGSTAGYLLRDLERPDVLLFPLVRESGVDLDGDGRFDQLEVVIGVDTLRPGTFTLTSILGRPGGGGIDASAEEVTLPAGRSEVTLHFSGSAIGASTADGPYRLVNVAIYPAHHATVGTAIVSELGETRAYRCHEFAGCSEVGDLDALVALIAGLPVEKGLRSSLLAKAENARKAFERGNGAATTGILGALANELDAQRGKGVSEADADRALAMIDAIIARFE